MQTNDSVLIIDRFFLTLETLKERKVIRGTKTFCTAHGINRSNLLQLRTKRTRGIFQPAWLTYLVNDYNISPRWLLTGEGDMFGNCENL